MNNSIFYLLSLMYCISCGNPSGTAERKDTISNEQMIGEYISIKATILSVKEELVMPSDYLTTAMTVKTINNDTLVFLDMFGFEELVNQDVSIKYNFKTGGKLLVCFDCTSFSEKVRIYDITSFPSDVTFESLRFKKYIQDPYIVPASTFVMIKEDGSIENFSSNDNDLVSDSLKMSSSFFSYGIITKLYPELENREELEQLLLK